MSKGRSEAQLSWSKWIEKDQAGVGFIETSDGSHNWFTSFDGKLYFRTPAKELSKVFSPAKQKQLIAEYEKQQTALGLRNHGKSPDKKRKSAKSPAKKRKASKSPAKKRKASKSPAKKRKASKSPAKKRKASKSPAKKRKSAKSPGKKRAASKSPRRMNKVRRHKYYTMLNHGTFEYGSADGMYVLYSSGKGLRPRFYKQQVKGIRNGQVDFSQRAQYSPIPRDQVPANIYEAALGKKKPRKRSA
jgi:hypothetical protein